MSFSSCKRYIKLIELLLATLVVTEENITLVLNLVGECVKLKRTFYPRYRQYMQPSGGVFPHSMQPASLHKL